MSIIAPVGVILAVIAIIYFSWKGLNILIAAPLATLFVVIINQMNIIESLVGKENGSYMFSLANYILNFFAIFLLGSILAKLMEESGASVSIAEFIIQKVGHNNPFHVLVAIFITSAVLTYGGISLFVVMFAVLPLAKSLFKKMNLAWNLIQIPLWLGIATVTMTILPGTPAIQNVIPIQYLDTSLTAASIPSLLGSIGCIVFGLIYMRRCLTKSLAQGENFHTYTPKETTTNESRTLPNFNISISPLVLLIVIALSGSIFGNDVVKKNIIYVALISGILLALLLFKSFIPNKLTTLNSGAAGSIAPIFATASAVAFGSVVTMAPGFKLFADAILNIPGSPLISLTVLTSTMSAITGSSSGALGIIMPNFAEHYLATGIHPELIHRVAAVASNMLTIVPQSGVFLTFLGLTGLTHKNGFKYTFITVTGGTAIAIIIIISLGLIIY